MTSYHVNPQNWAEDKQAIVNISEQSNVETEGTIFCDACARGDAELVKEKLECNRNLIYEKDPSGYFPLHWAALYNQCEIVELLLAYGADPLEPGAHGDTPFHWSTKLSSLPVFNQIVNHLLSNIISWIIKKKS